MEKLLWSSLTGKINRELICRKTNAKLMDVEIGALEVIKGSISKANFSGQ